MAQDIRENIERDEESIDELREKAEEIVRGQM
jgi:hypothetical protein